MGTKHQSTDSVPESKRRRGAGFAEIDAGIEPKECMKIYLVSSKEEVDSPNCLQIEPVDLNQFFEDDGKIYGYKGLKITVWVSSISFHAYADISFESTSDGGKGITDLKSSLQDIFAENLVDSKDEFLQTFATEGHYVKSLVSGAKLVQKDFFNDCGTDGECVTIEVFRVADSGVGDLYSRVVPFVLLLVDGSNPIDVTDPRWEIYILVEKNKEDSGMRLLGFAAVYRFYRYPDSVRLRLGQILVVPPYQRKGYGRTLLNALNYVAILDGVYDLTIEEPVDSLQHVRTCIDVQILRVFDPIQEALNSVVSQLKQENLSKKSQPFRCGPPANIVEEVRSCFKINKRQFTRCWEILIFLSLDPIEKYMENYKTMIANRVKADILGKESEGAGKRLVEIPTQFDEDMSFSMFKSGDGVSAGIEKDENQGDQEEQLRKLVDERMKAIIAVARNYFRL